MRILQINTSANTSAPGRIASEIGYLLMDNGHESFIAYGRTSREEKSSVIKITNIKDISFHILYTRLFDRHGFGSKKATERFINRIMEINPDVIHLHNLHGYYIHIGVLFGYLKKAE
ncbi:MAG TPA: glycosyl transferase, partial [Candidatus Cloacimonadota bacterium]|nr:glycosyl transferase [Candidatus Cloacimonadota bacterium]